MSVCRKRLIMWLILTGASVIAGIAIDIYLKTQTFPLSLRALGLFGIIVAHFPLKRTGKLLKDFESPEAWGCTIELVTTDIYQCLRHPHHLAVGLFMTSIGLLVGHPASFLVITITQWTWVIAFLFLVEEKELVEKFGEEYEAYRQKTPMLLPKPSCIIKVFTNT